MADWKVFRTQIEVMPHPNAERLEIGKAGQYPVVFQKGLYKTGDIVIFVPEKAILPDNLQEGFKQYLRGPNKDRVGSMRLRGEPTMGILLPDRPEFVGIPLDDDISEKLGIVKYEPPVPTHLRGKIKPIGTFTQPVSYHDVEQFFINKDQFKVGEEVIITEKLHGSQCHIIRNADGASYVSSKGLIKRQFVLEPEDANSYWAGVRNSQIFELLNQYYADLNVEAYGELIPCQKGFTYGQSTPIIRLFDIRINGEHVKHEDIPDEIKTRWVPVVYRGPYDPSILNQLADQKERVSGHQLHWAEGIVLRPYPDRLSSGKNPFRLMLKVISKHYKDDEEAIS